MIVLRPRDHLMADLQHPEEARYDGLARFIHWSVVVLVTIQFVIGWTMPHVHQNTKPVGLIAWHLGVGATLVAAMALRIVWRLTHRPPREALSPLLTAVSRITHWLIYAALVIVPVLGWANASSRGWTVKLLGLVPYPTLTPAGSAFGHAMGDVHGVVAWVLFALIGMHIAAALFHRFVLRDNVLQRMFPLW
jgi:cytochrome b561